MVHFAGISQFSPCFSPKVAVSKGFFAKIGQIAQNAAFSTVLAVGLAGAVSTPATPPNPPPPQVIPPGVPLNEVCNMQIPANTARAAPKGEVTIRWQFESSDLICGSSGHYGCTTRIRPILGRTVEYIELVGPPPDFHDVCGMARIGHEVLHAMGGLHNQ